MSTDAELFERWRAGDANAGNQLFQRHFNSVYRFFKNKVAGEFDELVQTTFLACVRAHETFLQQSSFRTFLFAIARHQLYDYLRRRQRGPKEVDFSAVSVLDLGTTPTGRIAHAQERELLLHALRSLPVEQQVMLELYYWEDMGSAELADIFDVPDATMRARLSRARKALRRIMEESAESHGLPASITHDLDAWAEEMREVVAVVSAATTADE
jgi:RNA polymerase sigma factor (sigma-70 family)